MEVMNARLLSTAVFGLAAFAFAGDGAESGLNVGDSVPQFHPDHIAGPHIGTDACPP